MPFRRRFNANIRPVNRIKHVVDQQGATVAANTETISLIKTTDTPTLAQNDEVETGSKVNAIYLHVEIVNTGTTGVIGNVYMIVAKNPGGNLTLPIPNVVGINDNKKYVIHQEMVMMQMVDNSNPRTLFNGVILIPKGYRRNGPNDLLTLSLLAPGVEINWCMQCHYKEFR